MLTDIVRSGTLAGILPAATDVLATIGTRILIDLRTADERVRAPEPDLSAFGIAPVWAPVVERDPAPLGVNLEWGHAGYLWEYQNYLEYGRTAMRDVVHSIADSTGGVLYHCSAGEDRTGVVTAVLLDLVGVPEQEILDDHALSVTVESLAARGITGASAAQRATAPLRGLSAMFAMVRERWGSMEGYLLDAGASPSAIDAVRSRARR